ncbi:hypothetical protein OL599_16280, partial [Rhodovastum sp. RN2-1]|nr:hypothetical protein [Limobrevibacterium gyesilva]
MTMPCVRFLPILLLALAAGPAAAQPPAPGQSPPDVIALVRADRWAEAQAAAAGYPDPVAGKLVTYYRLLAPNAAGTAEIAAFMASSPDWPQQATLARRRDEALAGEPDDSVALAECDRTPAKAAAALLRCAETYDRAGRPGDSAAMARRAWISDVTDPAWEARFLMGFGTVIGRDDQWRRFDRLAWTDTASAARQASRLDPADRARAEARLAFRRDDPNAPALLAAVPESQRADPGLFLDQARWLRRAGQDDAALALW